MQDSALAGVKSLQTGLAHSVLGNAMSRMAEAQKLERALRNMLPPAMAAAVRVYPSSSPIKTIHRTDTPHPAAAATYPLSAGYDSFGAAVYNSPRFNPPHSSPDNPPHSQSSAHTFQLCCTRSALLQKLRLMLPDLHMQLAQAGLTGQITALRLLA